MALKFDHENDDLCEACGLTMDEVNGTARSIFEVGMNLPEGERSKARVIEAIEEKVKDERFLRAVLLIAVDAVFDRGQPSQVDLMEQIKAMMAAKK